MKNQTPFEAWFRKEYPLYRADRDSTLKEALKRCWNAAVAVCLDKIKVIR